MARAGVPMVPGTEGSIGSAKEVRLFGEEHGFPVAVKASAGRRRQGLRRRRRRHGGRGRLLAGEQGGRGLLRGRLGLRREVPLGSPPRGDTGRAGQARERRPPRREGLLDPTPPPEAPRRVPEPRHRPPGARGDGRGRPRRRRGRRLRQRRHRRVPGREGRSHRRVLLPGDEHPRPGRAPRDGRGDGDRHREDGHPRSRRRKAPLLARRRLLARPRHRGAPERGGRRARLRPEPRRRDAPTRSPAVQGCGWTLRYVDPASWPNPTIRCSPSSSSAGPTGRRPSRGWGGRSRSSGWRESPRRCLSSARSWPTKPSSRANYSTGFVAERMGGLEIEPATSGEAPTAPAKNAREVEVEVNGKLFRVRVFGDEGTRSGRGPPRRGPGRDAQGLG